jgi:hypothetical protein
MNIDTRLVSDPADLEKVFRFRYGIYIDEMKRSQQYANHQLRTIYEPLDQGAVNFAAYEESTIVGAVRLNWGSQAIGYYGDLYRMDMAGPWHPEATTITTKLMVARSHRRSPVAARLAMATFAHAYQAGARFDFIDCNPPLDRFFAHLGYRQVIPDFRHPEYGLVRPMVLSLADRAHLTSVGSPFAGELDGLPDDPEAARFGREFLFVKGAAPSRRSQARGAQSPAGNMRQPALWAQANGGEAQ